MPQDPFTGLRSLHPGPHYIHTLSGCKLRQNPARGHLLRGLLATATPALCRGPPRPRVLPLGSAGHISIWIRPAHLGVPQTDAAPGGEVGVGGRWGGPGLLGLRLQPAPAQISIPAWLRIPEPRVWIRVPAAGPALIKLVASALWVSSAEDPASQARLETLVLGTRPGEGGGGGEGAAASFPKSGP